MALTESTRNQIKLLPEHLIDQIKAGEVVEKPASLIKELLENSIDAGATKIDIHLINNGMDLIKIDDNGRGMTFEELPFAFGRHATSKISKYDDLFNLHSFGFRGEALASISAVSRITCTSHPIEENLKGGKIIIHGGKIESHSHSQAHTHGTSLYVKDLFYNTPVRLKFLKSQTSEKNSITRIINAFILSNIHVEFSVKIDDKDKVIYPIVEEENFAQRVKKVFFKKNIHEEELILIEKEYDGHRLKGFLSKSASGGYSGKKQFLFANNRFFQDKAIHQNIMRQAEKIWGAGQAGHYALLLEIPPRKIDVNIHPNKIQIKFQENSLIYTLIGSSIKEYVSHLNYHPTQTGFSFEKPIEGRNQIISNNEAELPYLEQEYSRFQSTHFATTDGSKSVVKLSERFFIKIIDETSPLLIDIKKLYLKYWQENLRSSLILENVLSPLLITEPFYFSNGNIDSHFEAFKEIGFELDRVDNNLIVLRAIPNYLNATDYLPFLRVLIERASNYKKSISKHWFLEAINELKKEEIIFYFGNENSLNELLEFFDMNSLEAESIVKPLTDNLLLEMIIK